MATNIAGAKASPATRRNNEAGLLRRIIKHRYDYIYVAPTLAIMALVILYPFVYTIILSFFNTPANRPQMTFDGFRNYTDVASHPLLGLVTYNTILWTIGGTIFSFGLGLIAALVANQKVRGVGMFRALMILPYVIGQVTAAYLWRWLMHGDFGVISRTLMQLNLISEPIPFMQDPNLVMISLIIVNTWKTFPFAMVMLLAGLQAIPGDLYEAARVDGANPRQEFFAITIPQLRPVITVTTLLLIIGNMNSFTIPYLMTGGGPANRSELIITWIYNTSFQTLRFGFASAVSVMLFLVLFVFSYFYARSMTRSEKLV